MYEDTIKNKEFLDDLYNVKGMSISQIARQYTDGREAMVEYYLKKFSLYGKGKFKNYLNPESIKPYEHWFSYYAGLVASDGYVDDKNSRVVISMTDEGIVPVYELFNKEFNYVSPVKHYSYGSDKRGTKYEYVVSSKELIDVLEDVYNIPRKDKTHVLQFPENLPTLDHYKMYLRGISDGDGNIRKGKSAFRITEGSEVFIDSMAAFLTDLLGMPVSKSYQRGKTNTYPKIEITGERARKFLGWLYDGYPGYRLERKYLCYAA